MNKHELINSHIPLAETLAKKKKRAVNKTVYYEELESAALSGLVDAASRYESAKGPFSSYAARRINGEMEDYIRDLSWSRYVPVKLSSIDDALSIPDEQDSSIDTDKIVSAMMDLLPTNGRQMFKWYYQDKLTLRQIGERLGISESMVSLHMKRYRDSLRKRRDEILALAESK